MQRAGSDETSSAGVAQPIGKKCAACTRVLIVVNILVPAIAERAAQ
jgi:hypothetical protein